MARRIPIRNLYYLLCYAWDVLEERDDALVSELEGHGPHRLTATGVDLTQDWRIIHQRLLDIVANA